MNVFLRSIRNFELFAASAINVMRARFIKFKHQNLKMYFAFCRENGSLHRARAGALLVFYINKAPCTRARAAAARWRGRAGG